jgi:hypothetical protein
MRLPAAKRAKVVSISGRFDYGPLPETLSCVFWESDCKNRRLDAGAAALKIEGLDGSLGQPFARGGNNAALPRTYRSAPTVE